MGSITCSARIHGELLKLDLTVSQATVSKYMVRHRRPRRKHGARFRQTPLRT